MIMRPLRHSVRRLRRARFHARGFSLIELLLTIAIIGILIKMAYPSYQNWIIRTSREAAETQLQQLANLQEKIYLNCSAYTTSVTTAYTGQPASNVGTCTNNGGLGNSSGLTVDGKYAITFSSATLSAFTLQAAPVAGTSQVGDGNVRIDHTGKREWDSPNNGTVAW